MSRPPKRTHADADGSNSPPSSLQPLPKVKHERSPSPLLLERKLVTSGAKRFAPIPDNCLAPCTEYRRNRLEWVERCAKELEALSLFPEKRLFRDDGLVIDWRSPVPVWSDSLKPDPQDLAATIVLAHRSNAQWHLSPVRRESPAKSISTQQRITSSPVSDTEPPLKKRLPVPPRPSSRHRNNPSQLITVNTPPSGPGSSSPCTEGPRLSAETDGETPARLRDCLSNSLDCLSNPSCAPSKRDQFGVFPGRGTASNQLIILDAPSAVEEEMSEMTLNYLRRYIQTYESDRASLAPAYASNASFGYRTRQSIGSASSSPQCYSSGTQRTRLDIVTALLTLPPLHLNSKHSGIAQIEYDIFYLGAKLGMFVVCRMADSTKTVVHNFILQRKEVDVEDAAIEGIWPLTATAHQILVFQT